MPDLEGVGEAVTGAAVARAVEPGAGEADGHTHERNCLNCGMELRGDYCHACGQKAHVHRTLRALGHDLVHGVLHLDGKVWRTLPLLAWHPGELTRRYSRGERARFVSPLAMFLFSVFLMFAVFSFTGSSLFGDPTGVQAGISDGIRDSEVEIARLEAQRAAVARSGGATAAIDRRLASEREDLVALRRMRDTGILGTGSENVDNPVTVSLQDGPVPPFLAAAIEKVRANPSLLLYKIQTNAYKFSWALIPLSVPFMWLLFLHRRRYREQYSGYDHFVFVTYSIAAMSMALILFVLLQALGIRHGLVTLAFLLVPPVHMYRQLKGAYELSRWGAAWRTFVLLWFAAVVLNLFGLLLLAAGVFG